MHVSYSLSYSLNYSLTQSLTSDGTGVSQLHVRCEFPPAPGPHPAVVLAPGARYTLDRPVLAHAAQALLARGVAVFRFDWRYEAAQPRGGPSEDLVPELQDFQAVLALARHHARVRGDRIMAAGKSMGSVVAWRALAADPALRGAVLLTPLCSRVPPDGTAPRLEAGEHYPGARDEGRPVLFIAGDRDPLCAPPLLHAWAEAEGGPGLRVAVVGGDHGLEHPGLPAEATREERERDMVKAATLAADFVAEVLGLP